MSETLISRGEVYYIKAHPDTSVGSEQKAGRPAVVVSNNTNNKHSPTVEICYLTLQEKPPLPTHVFVDKGACINSTIMCEQITTISVTRLGDYMCRLSDSLMEKVDKACMISLGIEYIENTGSQNTCVDSTEEDYDLQEDYNALLEENEELKLKANEAEIYKNMYNELLDRVMRR